MNLRVLAIPLSFAAAAAALFITLNILGTRETSPVAEVSATQAEETPTQVASLDTTTEPEEAEAQPAEESTEQPVAEEEVEPPVTDSEEEPSTPYEGVPTVEVTTEATDETNTESTSEGQEEEVETGTSETIEQPSEEMPADEGVPTTEEETSAETQSEEEQTTEQPVEEPPLEEQPLEEPSSEEEPAQEQPIEEQPIVEEPIELVALPIEEQARFGRTMVEGDGTLSILQGSGVAGSVLEILVDGQVLITTNVNPSGNWSLYQAAALPMGVNSVTLRSRLADGRVGLSDHQLIAFLPDDGGEVKGALIDGGNVTVLNAPRFVSKLTLEGVIYTRDGAILFGKAPAGAEVSFTGGTSPSALIGSNGVWSLNLGTSTSGTLVQRSPVTGQEMDSVPLSLPSQPFIDEGEAAGLAGGVALGLKDQTILLF